MRMQNPLENRKKLEALRKCYMTVLIAMVTVPPTVGLFVWWKYLECRVEFWPILGCCALMAVVFHVIVYVGTTAVEYVSLRQKGLAPGLAGIVALINTIDKLNKETPEERRRREEEEEIAAQMTGATIGPYTPDEYIHPDEYT